MNEILKILSTDPAVAELKEIFSRRAEVLVYGAAGTQKVAAIAAAFFDAPRPTVIISGGENISDIKSDLEEFLPGTEIAELPELDLMRINATAAGLERRARRLEISAKLLRGENLIVLATPAAAVKKDLSRNDFLRSQIRLEVGQKISPEYLIEHFSAAGYERSPEVDGQGKFSVRGGIIDIFAINAPRPVRVEFFGDEIDSMREFNPETKRSEKNIDASTIFPVMTSDENFSESFLTCAGENGTIIFDEPAKIREAVRALVKENPEVAPNIFSFEDLINDARGGTLIYLELMQKAIRAAKLDKMILLDAAPAMSFHGQINFFFDEISRQLDGGKKIFLAFASQKKLVAVKNLLADANISSDNLILTPGNLREGFVFPKANIEVVTEKDIFGAQGAKRARRSSDNSGERIRHFREINPGDYVVHPTNGIGKYLGVETLELGGTKRDYLQIQYGGEDKLYIPTDQAQFLQKYISADGATTPRLSRLGSGDWNKAKSRAAAAVEDIAEKLLEIYARRADSPGFAFEPDDATQAEFEDAFPYEETPDQLRAIAEIKADMEAAHPMDRLICGDVGFGKTEIAIRAAYKAAMNGKQCAVLVPTTVLAWQHFQTFTERFKGFLPTVDVVCRFRTPKERRTTLQKVRAGQVDILIGTHAILNTEKIAFKNLGLLIIDEEQRFGVKQKEKIRDMTAGVDVLTLSATPIPRTLHMSLVGARDLSLIETPPAERFPVQTYVVEDDDAILAEAILREIRRGGQVYFVYNRIETIDLMRDRLAELVPEARIQTAHGQQSEDLLEQVMTDFYNGAFDVLLCTTIVENGLDLTNANTIIIYDADNFGLAQLYQMRGRVGRSHRLAFAYLVHRPEKVLSETAEKRLQAMKEFAKLGAGFKIAMRDLEIRGAGNLLGAQQHGHIASVGFEMYCQLLEEAVARLQEREPEEVVPEPTITLSSVDAFIDDKYISESVHKIEIYKRLASVRDLPEVADLLDELIDRFGTPGAPVLNLLEVAKIKCLAKKIDVQTLQEKNLRVEIIFGEKARISPDVLGELLKLFRRRIEIRHETRTIILTLKEKKSLLKMLVTVLKKFAKGAKTK